MHDAPRPHRNHLPTLLAASLCVHGVVLALWQRPAAQPATMDTTLMIDLRSAPVATPPIAHATPQLATQIASARGTAPQIETARPVAPAIAMQPQTIAHPAPAHAAMDRTRVDIPADRETGPRAAPVVAETGLSDDHLRARLIEYLQAYFDYPRLGRRLGWEGEVRLAVTVEPHGGLSRVRLAQTSGIAGLDQAALTSAGAIHAVPDAASLLHGRRFDMELPVTYRLIDG